MDCISFRTVGDVSGSSLHFEQMKTLARPLKMEVIGCPQLGQYGTELPIFHCRHVSRSLSPPISGSGAADCQQPRPR